MYGIKHASSFDTGHVPNDTLDDGAQQREDHGIPEGAVGAHERRVAAGGQRRRARPPLDWRACITCICVIISFGTCRRSCFTCPVGINKTNGVLQRVVDVAAVKPAGNHPHQTFSTN